MVKEGNIQTRSTMGDRRISYIIAYKEADIYRRRNLLFQINKILSFPFEKEIIVVEFDIKQHLSNIKNIKYFCIPTISDMFNKSLCYNWGYDHASYENICFIDADLILEDCVQEQALDLLDDGFDVIDPYTHVSYLDNKNTIDFMSNNKFNHFKIVESGVISGGAFFVKKDKYLRFDERFQGYGYEDDMYDNQIFKNNQIVGRLEGRFSFHMWHPTRKDMNSNNRNLFLNEKKVPKKIKYIKI